jgi:hypothetical protein
MINEIQKKVYFVFKVSQQAAKCIPAMVCPELTEQIRREIAASLHQRKGDFACYFLTDLVTFTLPAGNSKIQCEKKFLFYYRYNFM